MNLPRTVRHQHKTGRDSHVPFGLRREVKDDGTIVEKMYDPTQVDNGELCNCVCPSCKSPLIAKANKKGGDFKVIPHFAHASEHGCQHATESAVHKAAKQLIDERKEIYLPEYIVAVTKKDISGKSHDKSKTLQIGGLVKVSNVRLEENIADFRPDLIVTLAAGEELIIEIAVTSFVSTEKLKKIEAHGVAAIQIDVSMVRHLDFSALERTLFEQFSGSEWLFHPERYAIEAALNLELKPILDMANSERLKLIYEQEAQKQAQEKIRGERKNAESFKAKSFEEKLTTLLNYLEVQESEIPWYLDLGVYGEDSFGVPRKVWQLAIFAEFIHSKKHKFYQKDVLEWLKPRFSIANDFLNSSYAVNCFLGKLSEVGILDELENKGFQVKKINL